MRKWFLVLISAMLFNATVLAAENKKLTVLLDWFPSPNHAPLFVAQQQGFFKQQGLDVELIAPADPADPPKLVAAGKVDLAITYHAQLLLDVDAGIPLVRVATLIKDPLNCLAVLASSPVHNLADLKGKRIGYSDPAVDEAVLKTMFNKVGIKLSDLKLINVHFNLTQALLSNNVDAVIGMGRNFEVAQLQLLNKPARIFVPEKYGVPMYDEFIIVAQRQHAQDINIKKFVYALTQGVNYLRQHPHTTWEQFSKQHPELNNQLNRWVWFSDLPHFTNQPGHLNQQRYEVFAKYLQQQGVIKQVPTLASYAMDIPTPQLTR
ncbi:MAG: ABC transporter substrate-binding protein [Gammaproteobacteria bacterium]